MWQRKWKWKSCFPLAHIYTITIKIGKTEIKQSECVRNLGAFLDSKMNMEKHINTVCRSGYMQLRQIGHIRKYLTTDATKSLVNSLVTSSLDYCNALLSGVPKIILGRLQTLQNTAARIITRTSRYEHITPVLKELHWIPVNHRVEFKVLMLTYKALSRQVTLETCYKFIIRREVWGHRTPHS